MYGAHVTCCLGFTLQYLSKGKIKRNKGTNETTVANLNNYEVWVMGVWRVILTLWLYSSICLGIINT